jgi:hypothetical protein
VSQPPEAVSGCQLPRPRKALWHPEGARRTTLGERPTLEGLRGLTTLVCNSALASARYKPMILNGERVRVEAAHHQGYGFGV